jgi:2-polyprenyl-3-methyl-5-hydroxy-6-metoxy-1,4-benzoquinol methylase
MPILSDYARQAKTRTFFHGEPTIPADARILEIGCGDGWLGRVLRAEGWTQYTGLDLAPPADFVGDVRDWRTLGIGPESFDVIVAFEVVEHVPCFQECHDLLRPGGLLMLTSPIPERDWICALLERMGLNQRRSSPHTHLIDFRTIPLFEPVWTRRVGGLAQWGVFRKPGAV